MHHWILLLPLVTKVDKSQSLISSVTVAVGSGIGETVTVLIVFCDLLLVVTVLLISESTVTVTKLICFCDLCIGFLDFR